MNSLQIDTRLQKPLHILGVREVTFPPAHFSYVEIGEKTLGVSAANKLLKIKIWVQLKTIGRYCIYKKPVCVSVTNNDTKRSSTTMIGFEKESDMTLFLLSCPFLN
jgi:hypothetical protein